MAVHRTDVVFRLSIQLPFYHLLSIRRALSLFQTYSWNIERSEERYGAEYRFSELDYCTSEVNVEHVSIILASSSSPQNFDALFLDSP